MVNMLMTRCLLVFSLVLVPLSVQSRAAETKYDLLLAKVKAGDSTVDFREMRLAYAETPRYNPYGGGQSGMRDAMFAAMAAKNYAAAVDSAEKVMLDNYVDIDAHMIASIANDRLGKEEKAAYHRAMVRGLLKSILEPGDGMTPETAYKVISVDEEYVILYVLGLDKSRQATQLLKGHNYDTFTVTEPGTDIQFDLFFNIDIPFTWLQKSLKKD